MATVAIEVGSCDQEFVQDVCDRIIEGVAESAESTETEVASESPELDADWQAKKLAEIQDLERECQEAESEYDDAAEHAKDLKKKFERKVEQLRKAIRFAEEKLPLFDDADCVESTVDATGDQQPDDLSWRDVSLGDLEGVTDKMLDKLDESNLTTVGELSDYLQEKELTNVAGIGPVSADKITTALEKFWKNRNDAVAVTEVEPTSDGTEASE